MNCSDLIRVKRTAHLVSGYIVLAIYIVYSKNYEDGAFVLKHVVVDV